VTLEAVTVKVCDVDPCGTVTDLGTLAAVEELESDTVTPPLPAAAVSVTVPVPGCPLEIVEGLTEIPLSAAGAGLMVSANVLLTLESDAVSVTGVEVVTLPLVTVNVVDVDPCWTTTLAGTLAAAVLELESQTVQLPEGAAAVRVAVPVPV
jgi:hypothetical protein